MAKLKVLFFCLFLVNSIITSADEDYFYQNGYEEEYKKIFQNYLGFYIYVDKLSNVFIIKLSLNKHLILQRYYIENNELLEGEIIILDKIFVNYETIFFYQNSRGLSNNECELFYYTHIYFVPVNDRIRKQLLFIYYETEKNNSYIFFNMDDTQFTKNIDDVINIVNSNDFDNTQNLQKESLIK
jgi:hypothetical protein